MKSIKKHKGKFFKKVAQAALCAFLAVSVFVSGTAVSAFADETEDAPLVGGVITGYVTSNFSAIGLEYFERGVLWGIGTASNKVESEGVSTALSYAKRILGNPQSSTLGQILKLCQEISANVKQLQADVRDSSAHIEALLTQMDVDNKQQDYNNTYKVPVYNFTQTYASFYNQFYALVDAMQAYSENPTDANYGAVGNAYAQIEDFYNADTTAASFSAQTLGNNLLSLISPYEWASGSSVSTAYNDPTDQGSWGNKTTNTTYLDALYEYSIRIHAFEHDVYNDMVAGINDIANAVNTYLTAYRVYVEFGAMQINSDPSLSESERQSKITTLWNGFDICRYMALCALEQACSLYDGELSGYMRGYDADSYIQLNYSKAYADMNLSDPQSSGAEKTSEYMYAYQVKPVGEDTTYAIIKGASSDEGETGNEAMSAKNMTFKAGDWAGGVFKNNSYEASCDFRNLLSAKSPSGYALVSSASDLSGLFNSKPYGLYADKFVTFLKSQGLETLPDISENGSSATDSDALKKGQFLLTSKIDRVTADNRDENFYWINISYNIDADNAANNTVKLDAENDIYDEDDINGKEIMAILCGQPSVNLSYGANVGSASVTVYALDDSGNITDSVISSGSAASGQGIAVKVKPKDGETIKSINLVDTHTGEIICSLAGGSIYEGDTDEDAENFVSVEEYVALLTPDEDGYYTFRTSVPYRNAEIQVTTGTPDEAVSKNSVTLMQTDAVSGETNGEVQFLSNDGITVREYGSGEEVYVQVRPYDGYVNTGLVVTAADGSEISAEEVTSGEYRTTPTTKCYKFIMPSGSDVTVYAAYEKGYTVSLDNANTLNGSLAFTGIDCLNEDWLTYPITFAAGETVEIAATPSSDVTYFCSNIIVRGSGTRDIIESTPTENGVKFIMPSEDVSVMGVFSSVNEAGRTVTFSGSEHGSVFFANSDGSHNTDATTNQHLFNEGDTVYFKLSPDIGYAASEPVVRDYYGADVEFQALGDNLYSFTMPSVNVTVTSEFTATPYSASIVNSSGGQIVFDDGSFSRQYFYGDTVCFKVLSLDGGYGLSKVSVTDSDGCLITVTESDGAYTFVMPADNVTVNAQFAAIVTCTVNLNPANNGTLKFADDEESGDADSLTFLPGEDVFLTVEPDDCFALDSLSIYDDAGNEYEYERIGESTMYFFEAPAAGNVYVTAAFARSSFRVTYMFYDTALGEYAQMETRRVKIGGLAEKIAARVISGRTFTYWALSDGSEFDFTAPIESDIVLYAKYDPDVDSDISGANPNTGAVATGDESKSSPLVMLMIGAACAGAAAAALYVKRKKKA